VLWIPDRNKKRMKNSSDASGESDAEEECGNFACVLTAWVGGVGAGVGSTQHVDTLFLGTNKWAESGEYF
jgi:hypothetical protein